MTGKPDDQNTETPISKEEFDKRDDALTHALDKLEKEVSPRRPKPAPIGAMV
jgi:hypothetical protein